MNSFSSDFLPWPTDYQKFQPSPPNPRDLAELIEKKPMREWNGVYASSDSGESTAQVTVNPDDPRVWREMAMSNRRYLYSLNGDARVLDRTPNDPRHKIESMEYWRLESCYFQTLINKHTGVEPMMRMTMDGPRFRSKENNVNIGAPEHPIRVEKRAREESDSVRHTPKPSTRTGKRPRKEKMRNSVSQSRPKAARVSRSNQKPTQSTSSDGPISSRLRNRGRH